MKIIQKTTNDILQNSFNIDFLKTHNWNQHAWKQVFNSSKKGKKFAQRVIWGFLLNDKLITSVRFNSHGAFIDEDGEEYFPHKIETIALITSKDLSQRNVNAWIEQFERKDIIPIFNQIKANSLNKVI